MNSPEGFDIIDLSVALQHRATSGALKSMINYIDHRKG